MISFNFEYHRPTSIDEAIQLFKELDSQGKDPVYYAGGTEIICMARMNQISTKAVIDIKEIPECNILVEQDNKIIIGAAVTLTKISETNIFPLLSKVIRNAADHTSRNKITIGGNICGRIPYREGVLPFLLCDSQVSIVGLNGTRVLNINDVFNRNLMLDRGEFLSQILTCKEYINLPFEAVKKTKQERVDYPLISVAAIKKNNQIRAAFSGVCAYPFRSTEMDTYLNKQSSSQKQMERLAGLLPEPFLSDLQGSAEFREYVLKNILSDILVRMGAK